MSNCPATDYALDALIGEIPACHYVKLACQRFMNDLRRTDIWYDREAAEHFSTYCTFLRHYKGPYRGMPLELDPWEKFVFGNIYGWMKVLPTTAGDVLRWDTAAASSSIRRNNPDRPVVGQPFKTNIWRFHYNYIEVPRKNGKTTIAAAGATYDCAYVEDTGAEVYCLATKEDQAKILWGDGKAFISHSDDLAEVFEVLEGRNTIYALQSRRTSFIRPLGANSEKLDGLNPLSGYCDELHEWPDRKLLDVIEDAFGARVKWHIIEITTAGYNKQGVCYQERKHSIDILEGRIVNDDKFCIIYTVDKGDEQRWKDEAVWFKANPSLGRGKQLEYMRSKAQKADQIPTELNTFLNKQLNVWTDVLEAWLRHEDWLKCQRTFNASTLIGKKCYAGGDLAKVSDLSAVAYYFPIQPGLVVPHVLVDFYCPEANAITRKERDKLPYDVWIKEGWITQTPGNTTDYAFIEVDILKKATMFDVQEIAFDRTFGGEIITNLMEEGMTVVDFGQGFFSMGTPTAELERLIVKHAIAFNTNPVLTWMSANVVTRRDPAGNMKPDKEASEEKIDGIVATLNALGRALATRESTTKTPYNKRGIRVLSST